MQNCTSDHGEMGACCIFNTRPSRLAFFESGVSNMHVDCCVKERQAQKVVCRENAHNQKRLSTRESMGNGRKVHFDYSTHSLFPEVLFKDSANQHVIEPHMQERRGDSVTECVVTPRVAR